MSIEPLDCLVREWKKSKQAPYINIEGAGGVKKNAPVYEVFASHEVAWQSRTHLIFNNTIEELLEFPPVSAKKLCSNSFL